MPLSEPMTATFASLAGAMIGTGVTLWLGVRQVRRQYLLEHQSEALVRRLLQHRKWRLRTFSTIRYHVAGFSDDQLRQILIRAGALRFEDARGIEVWGLLERNEDLLDREVGTSGN